MSRRMIGEPSIPTYSRHYGEHDDEDACSKRPRCSPASTNTIICDTTLAKGYDPPPEHYDRGIDPWAVWDAFDLDRYTANAVKYLLRAGKKDIAPRLDDLKKAANYIAKAIEMEQKNG